MATRKSTKNTVRKTTKKSAVSKRNTNKTYIEDVVPRAKRTDPKYLTQKKVANIMKRPGSVYETKIYGELNKAPSKIDLDIVRTEVIKLLKQSNHAGIFQKKNLLGNLYTDTKSMKYYNDGVYAYMDAIRKSYPVITSSNKARVKQAVVTLMYSSIKDLVTLGESRSGSSDILYVVQNHAANGFFDEYSAEIFIITTTFIGLFAKLPKHEQNEVLEAYNQYSTTEPIEFVRLVDDTLKSVGRDKIEYKKTLYAEATARAEIIQFENTRSPNSKFVEFKTKQAIRGRKGKHRAYEDQDI